ncbi:MAG: hypothetical protein ABI573_06140 [Chloroflexota bacterium]
MNPMFVGVALAISVGAIIAISARDARTALMGLAVTLVAAPFLSDPLPPLSTLAMRVVGAALAAYLLRSAVLSNAEALDRRRGKSGHVGSRIGWPTETLLAIAAWVVGINVYAHLLALTPGGPGTLSTESLGSLGAGSLATGAGLAVIVLAIVPALGAREGLRTAVGLVVLIQGILLFRSGVAGAPSDLEQLAGVALIVAAAVTGSMLVGLGVARDRGASADSTSMPLPTEAGSPAVPPIPAAREVQSRRRRRPGNPA